MDFRTRLKPRASKRKISHRQAVLGIGSCFVSSIGERLKDHKFSTLINPFGTLFHPPAIENALARILTLTRYSEEELFEHKELFSSWDHHSSFSKPDRDAALEGINEALEKANDFVRNAEVFILTFGTARVYKLKNTGLSVANCHKVPGSYFENQLLSDEELKTSIENSILLIKDLNPEAHIITTVSPVRHLKDGMEENLISKAKLISALYEVREIYPDTDYFPAYELLTDDLRDYRFYGEDMVHPNETAAQYIWEKFSEVYFSAETEEMNRRTEKIKAAMAHRPFNKKTTAYKEFIFKIRQIISDAESYFPKGSFDTEKAAIQKEIENAD